MGAKMVDFGGWDMPVQYSGILEEHHAVRNGVGLFDVSHMGEIEIRGPEAFALTDSVTTNAVAKLKIGQAQYSGLLYEHGGFVDDILVHKVADDHYFLCVNASNQDKDYEHIAAPTIATPRWNSRAPATPSLPIQGPKGLATLQKLTATDLAPIEYYHFTDGAVSGDSRAHRAHRLHRRRRLRNLHRARTGRAHLERNPGRRRRSSASSPAAWARATRCAWNRRWRSTATRSTRPSRPTKPDLGWIVKLDKGDFIGRRRSPNKKRKASRASWSGFEMTGRGIGRDGYEVYLDGAPAGWVTSGGPSPTLNKNIGLCYLPSDRAKPGQPIQIMIRNQPVEAVTVPTPFYKRAK